MLAPKKSTVWTIWIIVMVIYAVMNGIAVSRAEAPIDPKLIFGWGIIMPILTNLVWWAISFRLRIYFPKWWLFGILTAVFVGTAGFLTMLQISQISSGN